MKKSAKFIEGIVDSYASGDYIAVCAHWTVAVKMDKEDDIIGKKDSRAMVIWEQLGSVEITDSAKRCDIMKEDLSKFYEMIQEFEKDYRSQEKSQPLPNNVIKMFK